MGALRSFLDGDGRLDERRRDGLARQVHALALERLARRLDAASDPRFVAGLVDEVLALRIDPPTAADRLLDRLGP